MHLLFQMWNGISGFLLPSSHCQSSPKTTAAKQTHGSFQQVPCWPVLSNRSPPPHVYICAAPAMEEKRCDLYSWIHRGSGSKWSPITPCPHHPLCHSGYPVAISSTTFTPSSTSERTTLQLACKTHLANGGFMTGCGSLVRPGAITSKLRKISSSMDPAMPLSLFTAVAIADVRRLPFFPLEGPLLSPLSLISYYRHLFTLQYS